MDRRRLLEIVTVGLWLTIAVVFYLHYTRNTDTSLPVPEKLVLPELSQSMAGKTFEVKKLIVLRGDSFDITLKDTTETRVLGVLSVSATDDAKQKVIDLLNKSIKPRVVLNEKQSDNRWSVNIFVIVNDKEVSLSEWLESNKLVYK